MNPRASFAGARCAPSMCSAASLMPCRSSPRGRTRCWNAASWHRDSWHRSSWASIAIIFRSAGRNPSARAATRCGCRANAWRDSALLHNAERILRSSRSCKRWPNGSCSPRSGCNLSATTSEAKSSGMVMCSVLIRNLALKVRRWMLKPRAADPLLARRCRANRRCLRQAQLLTSNI